MEENNNITIEEAFAQLESITQKMQNDDMSLEDSFALYKQGLSLVELCNGKIEKIRCEIEKLTNTGE